MDSSRCGIVPASSLCKRIYFISLICEELSNTKVCSALFSSMDSLTLEFPRLSTAMASFVVDATEVITSSDHSILNLLLAVAANCWLNLFLFFKRPIMNIVVRVAQKCGSDRESLRLTDYDNYWKRSSIMICVT